METVFDDLYKNIKTELKSGGSLNINTVLEDIFKMDFIQDWIIGTIQDRLYEKGIDAKGVQLQTDRSLFADNANDHYSDITIVIKKRKSQKIDNVTLKDSGKFYNSWKFTIGKKFYNITANFKKPKGEDIFNNFEASYSNKKDFDYAILSLSDDENNLLSEKILKPEIISRYNYAFSKIFNSL